MQLASERCALVAAAIAVLAGCNNYVPCTETNIEIGSPEEVTPLGFSLMDAASAFTVDQTLAATYADGTPVELRVTTEVLLVPTPATTWQPPIPSYTTRRPADGLEHPGHCETVDVWVGDIETRLVSSDGMIDETWVQPLATSGELPGSIVATGRFPDEPTGTWRPSPVRGLPVSTRFVVWLEVSPDGAGFVSAIEISSQAVSNHPKGGEPIMVYLTYDAP